MQERKCGGCAVEGRLAELEAMIRMMRFVGEAAEPAEYVELRPTCVDLCYVMEDTAKAGRKALTRCVGNA